MSGRDSVIDHVRVCAPVNERFEVGTPSGMLDYFLRASADVHRYVSRLTGGDVQLTEDIVQETFIALFRHHRAGDDAVMEIGWLIRTARNRLIDHYRSRGRDQARMERHVAGAELESPGADFSAVTADQARWLLAQLPPQERLALGLHTVD